MARMLTAAKKVPLNGRRKKVRARSSRRSTGPKPAPAPVLALVVQTSALREMAKAEVDPRRQKFLMMLDMTWKGMNGDDIAMMEPILHRAFGRITSELMKTTEPAAT